MATFIQVSSAESELLRRNRDQVNANRLQKVEADEQAATGRVVQATVAERQALEQPGGRRQVRFRRDEPAAFRYGGVGLLVAGAPRIYDNVGLPAESSFRGASRFGLYAAPADDYRNFVVGEGPTAGTMSLTEPVSNTTDLYGFCFASNFVASLDLAACFVETDESSAWTGQLEDPFEGLILPPPALLDSSSRASSYGSFTFEFFIRRPDFGDVNVSTHNFMFEISSGGTTSIRLAGITSFNAINGSTSVDDDKNGSWGIGENDTQMVGKGQWFHAAYCKDDSGIRVYVKGKMVATSQVSPRYWNRYVELEQPGLDVSAWIINGSLPVMFSLSCSGSGELLRPAFHGIRWTPRALYSGAQFTPPVAINRLA